MLKEKQKSDILFYIKDDSEIMVTSGKLNIQEKDINFNEDTSLNIEEVDIDALMSTQMLQQHSRGRKSEHKNRKIQGTLIPVRKEMFQEQVVNMAKLFNEMLEKPDETTLEGGDDPDNNPRYILDQIEVNLGMEISGGLKLLLTAKGNAGIKLVFKRKNSW